eukprot:NODE_7421_length_441_cov_99.663212.p1 GENE.NODE_7421_length_441_cov_99.663212~~NODE_7421_length_441_cov_99.663212.p1  ORF type:complete len:132 (+),score=32.19 NODE_7421_length_441_cov_99.663212:3-398(+)
MGRRLPDMGAPREGATAAWFTTALDWSCHARLPNEARNSPATGHAAGTLAGVPGGAPRHGCRGVRGGARRRAAAGGHGRARATMRGVRRAAGSSGWGASHEERCRIVNTVDGKKKKKKKKKKNSVGVPRFL